MARVSVTPEEFHLVFFDAKRIGGLVEQVAQTIGLPEDRPIEIVVDETSPLGRIRIESLDPIKVSLHSGAFEHPKKPRHMSDRSVTEAMAIWLFRAKDRLDPSFGDPPPDSELTLPQSVAWNTYSAGRYDRLGLSDTKARRRYHFRVRHGFTDVSDAVFERLWSSQFLSWSDIEAACAETGASGADARQSRPDREGKAARARRDTSGAEGKAREDP